MSNRVTKLLDGHNHEPEAITISASRVTPRALDPVWDGFLWAGKPTLLAGDPGLGKSMLTADIAARVTTGEPWPCSAARREPANVVIMSAEDDPEDTIVPRLMAAAADLDRVTFVQGMRDYGDDAAAGRRRWLSLDTDLAALGDVLAVREPRLVIIDPLASYLGSGTDSHNEGDVRSVLAGVADLAARHRCSILAIRHLRKADSATAQHRLIGSVAFAAAARAVYIVIRDPADDDRRLVLCAKNNLAQDAAGYGYVIETTPVDVAGGPIDVPRVNWSADRELRSADEVLGTMADRTTAADDAEEWIRTSLADGPVASSRMRDLAKEAGHSWRTVERARASLDCVVIERDLIAGRGATGPWQWRLATPSPPRPSPPLSDSGGVADTPADTGSQPDSDSQPATPSWPLAAGEVEL
jgi:hypothetical protein